MNPTITLNANNGRDNADRLRSLGIEPPARLIEAIAVREALAVDLADSDPIETIVANATPDDIADRLAEWATAQAARAALTDARGEAISAADRRIHQAHAASADEILEAVRPIFTDTADTFTTAYLKLPPTWRDATALVREGGPVVEYHEQARSAAGRLDVCAAIRRAVPGTTLIGNVADALEFANVPHTIKAEQVAACRSTSALGRWADMFDVGEVEFVWRSIPEHRAAVKACPVWTMKARRVTNNGFAGMVQEPTPAHEPPPSRRPGPDWDLATTAQ